MNTRVTTAVAVLAVALGAGGLFALPVWAAPRPDTPIVMPVSGIVSVTGFGVTSLVRGSSDPSTVVLSAYQALELRASIEGLSTENGNPVCMEDSALLYVKVTHDGKTIWNAIADECPGVLRVTNPASAHLVNDRSCSFWHLVASFFPTNQATATRRDSQSVCADPQD
ncbi:MAG TPA: hypothetical protein VMF33_04960 [Acidimicrobiales bacterium]|nr:hypothetical protein [Acidimicrobiales bacterium]